jgi:hypothetical protein
MPGESIPRLRQCTQCGSMLAIGHACGTCIHRQQQRREKAEREAREQQEGEGGEP